MSFLPKLSACLLSLALCGSFAARAQAPVQQGPEPGAPPTAQHYGRHHNPEHETRMLTRKLGLSPAQAAQVEPILAARQQQMQSLHASNTDPQTMHQQAHMIQRDTRQKLDAVLTDTQRQQLRALHAEHHQHMQQGAPVQGAPTA